MTSLASATAWRARVRLDYSWPYPRLDPARWYAVRSTPSDDAGWLWLDTEPSPTHVFVEHLVLEVVPGDAARVRTPEPAALPAQSGAPEPPRIATGTGTAVRQARLRLAMQHRYGSIPAGVWMRARDLVALVRPRSVAQPNERRGQRLPERHFEFRDALLAGDADSA